MRISLTIAVFAIGAAFSSYAQALIDPAVACRLGAYTLEDKRWLIVTGWNGSSGDLTYLLSSGEVGHLKSAGGGTYLSSGHAFPIFTFSDCVSGAVMLREEKGILLKGIRVSLPTQVVDFSNGPVLLHGKLVLPSMVHPKIVVVWIQGSNDDPGTDDNYWQYVLPQFGIGVFTYDKRGTGSSRGEATANFETRVDDTIAAIAEIRRLLPGNLRVGLFGVSQGGWVAPLVATKTPVAFVIVGYGLAEGLTAQDRDVVADDLLSAGFGQTEIRKARALSDTSAVIVKSHARLGWTRFGMLEKRYRQEPWLKAIGTNSYTGVLLSQPLPEIEKVWRGSSDDTTFDYDPRPVISNLGVRQLWILAGADHTAPSMRTAKIIEALQRRKRSIDLVVLRNADHGMVQTRKPGDTTTRIVPSFFETVRDWIAFGGLPSPSPEVVVKSTK